jgi:restriction system protein
MAVWVVRAGSRGEREDFALEHGVGVIGWDEVLDLSRISTRDDLETFLRDAFPDEKTNTLKNWRNQIWAFRDKIQVDDLVVLPLKKRSAIAIGKVSGPYEYRPDFPSGARHTRRVHWLQTELPRTAFDQDLLYSFGAFLTVCQIQRNNAEERIRAMVEGGQPPSAELSVVRDGPQTNDDDTPSDEDQSPPFDIEQYARDQIQARIAQRYHGHPLADLVDSVLKAQGYTTEVSRPGPDGGVDIVAGGGPMGFDAPRIVVQVKSGTQAGGVDVLRQLQGVLTTFNAQHGVLVSWGGFRETVYREARQHFFSIRLWDAGTLVNELLRLYDQLPDDLQAELPLKRIWALVPEE